MKKITVCFLMLILLVGGAFAVRNMQNTNMCDKESETGSDLDTQKQSEKVRNEDGSIQVEGGEQEEPEIGRAHV